MFKKNIRREGAEPEQKRLRRKSPDTLPAFPILFTAGNLKKATVVERKGKIIIPARFDPHSPYLGWADFIVVNNWSNTKENKLDQVNTSLNNARIGNKESLYFTLSNYFDG